MKQLIFLLTILMSISVVNAKGNGNGNGNGHAYGHGNGNGHAYGHNNGKGNGFGRGRGNNNGHPVFDAQTVEVTITNLTKGQQFTPILVALQSKGSGQVFELGEPASDALAQLAEGGDSSALLAGLKNVVDSQSAEGLLNPGESVTLEFETQERVKFLTVASMLIPTNDAFFAKTFPINGRKKFGTKRYINAYDAGTETNDELCLNIPGPVCGGEGFNAGDGEGFVYMHNGIHGIGDLDSAERDWNGPVVKVEVNVKRYR